MIARTFSRATFADLASYLARGRDGTHPERVAWTAGRELPSDDPDLAAVVMEATARRSRKVEYPCYHVVVAWDLSDHPVPNQMETVVDALAQDLGLAQHQRLLVAHNDRPHPHVHLMLNRVHPQTGKAWERWKDRLTVERTLRHQERVHQFREVPGRLYRDPDQERALPTTRDTARHRPLSRTAQTLVERVRPFAADLARAARWSDVELRLAREGLLLEVRGRSLFVTDGHATIPLTRIDPALTRVSLEQRFKTVAPIPLPAPVLQELSAQLRTLAHGHELRGAVTTARQAAYAAEAKLAVARRESATPTVTAATRTLDEARRQLKTAEQALADDERTSSPPADLEHTVGLTMARLLPEEMRTLMPILSPTELALGIGLRDHTRERLSPDREASRTR